MILRAPAKLNLYLEVLGLRKDNYHNIKTLFSRINLSDTIILKRIREDKIKIISNNSDLPLDESNLCFRTARLLKEYKRIKEGLEIRIIKRIPIGSGLGGGSSDAASLLLGLNRLWRLSLTKKELFNFAKMIGSDVLFFLYNYPFGLGIGKPDDITPIRELNKTKIYYVLVIPKVKIKTAFIYTQFDQLDGFKLTKPKFDVNILIWGLKQKDSTLVKAGLFNHLEKIAENFYPEIEMIKKKFNLLGVKTVSMSGSGGCVFGLFFKRKEAEFVCKYLKKELGGCKIFLVQSF